MAITRHSILIAPLSFHYHFSVNSVYLFFLPILHSKNSSKMKNGFGWSSSSSSYRIKPFSPQNGQFPPSERKTDWRSIYLCGAFAFTASVQFTLFFTSLWPFMQILDPSVTVSYFGAVIAMYSLSQIVASPLLGIWSNRIEKLKPPLIFCNIFMFIGNMLYWLVELFPSSSTRYILCISRLIAGIGWGQVSLLKSYASAASVNEDRSRATAFATGGVALGTVMGPAFQMLFTWIGFPGYPICVSLFGHQFCLNLSNKFHSFFLQYFCLPLSMFTAPAIFASAMNVILMFFLILWFRENYVGILQRKTDKIEANGGPRLPPYDKLAVAVCFAMRFTQFFIFTNLETIGTAFAMMMFLWPATEVVFWESIAHSARGALALAVYIAYIVFNLGKKVNDRLACLCSLFGLFLFHIFTFSWPFLPENVLEVDVDPSLNTSIVGCDRRRFVWCDDLKQINVWLYYSAMLFCIGLAFPNINVTMNTLFSRIIGPRMQSKQQGMLEMFGGMGRMFGPLLIGFLYRNYGPRAIWILEMAEVGVMILLWLIFYRRLVPLRIPPELEEKREHEARGSFADSLPN